MTHDTDALVSECRRYAEEYSSRTYVAGLASRCADAIERLTRERDGASEERDAILHALGWKPNSLKTARNVILDDAAGLRPAMVDARRRAMKAESDAMLWHCSVAEGNEPPLLVRVWKRAKTAEAALSAARAELAECRNKALDEAKKAALDYGADETAGHSNRAVQHNTALGIAHAIDTLKEAPHE